ncbi:hypothetical protein [Streptomyces griseoloalbus]|uniref:hypothetical protein n=1 Tax=Streptomyces griseoloalbus TaxID=67303 RepID=UPI001875D5B8
MTRSDAGGRVHGRQRRRRETAVGRDARAYVRGLMEQVVPEQAWGVPAVADAGTAWAVKNGWLPRDATGPWVVHGVGRVTAGGRACLMAVLPDGNATKALGVTLVERRPERRAAFEERPAPAG